LGPLLCRSLCFVRAACVCGVALTSSVRLQTVL
jgi:hypothetical protein